MSEAAVAPETAVQDYPMTPDGLSKLNEDLAGPVGANAPEGQEASEQITDTGKTEGAEQISDKGETTTEEKPLTTEERLSSLEKEVRNKQLLIDRQGNELGELRKLRDEYYGEMNQKAPEAPKLDEDEFAIDPNTALQKVREQEKAHEAHQQKVQSMQLRMMAQQHQQYLDQTVPEHSEMVDDIFDAIKKDNPDVNIDLESFKRTMYNVNPGIIAVQVKRITAEREAEAARKEAESWKKKYEKFTGNLSKNGKASSMVGGATGGAMTTGGQVNVDALVNAHDMASALKQLNEICKE